MRFSNYRLLGFYNFYFSLTLTSPLKPSAHKTDFRALFPVSWSRPKPFLISLSPSCSQLLQENLLTVEVLRPYLCSSAYLSGR